MQMYRVVPKTKRVNCSGNLFLYCLDLLNREMMFYRVYMVKVTTCSFLINRLLIYILVMHRFKHYVLVVPVSNNKYSVF